MQSLVALGNLPLPEQEIVRQKWLLDESRAMANLPGSTWTDHHHFHLTNEVAVQGPMEGPLQHQFASRFEAWLTSRAHIFQNDMRAKLHDHRGWRAGDNDVYFAGEALKVQWQPHVRSTGELEKPGTVDIYAVSTRNLSGSAMGLNDFIYPLVQDVLNTGKHKVRLTMAHGIGKACLLVVSGGRDLSIFHHISSQMACAPKSTLLLIHVPHGLAEIGWPVLEAIGSHENATGHSMVLMQRMLLTSRAPSPIPGYAVLVMTNVKPDFIEQYPLNEWIQTACQLEGESGTKVMEELEKSPPSPRPEKFAYVPEHLVQQVIDLCNQVRKFSDFRDGENNPAGVVKQKQKMGLWPRFRRSKERPEQELV